jgi:hypothetical protein
MTDSNNPPSDRCSRAEAETLIVLNAIGTKGCALGDIALRLGLSSTLADVIAGSLHPLVSGGLLVVDGQMVCLTPFGREHLSQRLADLGVA